MDAILAAPSHAMNCGDASAEPPIDPPTPFDAIERPAWPIDDGFPESCADVRAWILAAAESSQYPADVLALGVLPVALVAIAGAAEVVGPGDWSEPASLWVLALSPSGERKSSAIRLLTDPIAKWERDEAARLAPVIARAEESRRIDEARLADLRKRLSKGSGTDEDRADAEALAESIACTVIPSVPRLIVDDVTSEAVARAMLSSGERALVASPEADVLDVIGGRYADGRMSGGNFLRGHAGDRIRVNRVNRAAESLERPALSVLLLVQPAGVEGMFSNRQARGRGLLARLLTAWPEPRCGNRSIEPRPIPADVGRRYHDSIRTLLELPRSVDDGPVRIGLTPGATALLQGFRAIHEPELKPTGEYGDRADWGSKLPGAVLRIALALSALGAACRGCARSAHDLGPIDESTMRAALAWVPYLSAMERLVSGVAGTDPDAAKAGVILAWLARSGAETFSIREAFNATRRLSIQRVDDLAPALDLLTDHRYVWPVPDEEPINRPGRKPSPRYRVNPAWDREVVR